MQPCAQIENEERLHPGVLWVGLEMARELSSLERLDFYFDFNGHEEKPSRELLPLIQWQWGETTVPARTGLQILSDEEKIDGPRYIDHEYLYFHRVCEEIRQFYRGQFITLAKKGGFQRTDVPATLRKAFNTEGIEEIRKEKHIWLKLIFPNGFPSELINNFKLRLNCFPIFNAKLDKTRDFTPANYGEIEMRALDGQDIDGAPDHATEFFLAMNKVFSNQFDYRPTTFESFRDTPPGYYALQEGRVEAHDFRDTFIRTEELIRTLQQYDTRFSQLSGHHLQNALSHLQAGYQELQKIITNMPAAVKMPRYYLHLKAQDPQQMIYVRFWVTQGKAAENSLSKGDLLVAQKSGALAGDGIWVV